MGFIQKISLFIMLSGVIPALLFDYSWRFRLFLDAKTVITIDIYINHTNAGLGCRVTVFEYLVAGKYIIRYCNTVFVLLSGTYFHALFA
jgi:hypothetical protein